MGKDIGRDRDRNQNHPWIVDRESRFMHFDVVHRRLEESPPDSGGSPLSQPLISQRHPPAPYPPSSSTHPSYSVHRTSYIVQSLFSYSGCLQLHCSILSSCYCLSFIISESGRFACLAAQCSQAQPSSKRQNNRSCYYSSSQTHHCYQADTRSLRASASLSNLGRLGYSSNPASLTCACLPVLSA